MMGMGALLIGGVGIINTMLVRVRHRALEIAALKTFGLKGRQVAALFLAEAAWLGVLGSALGCLGGVLLGGLVNSYGEPSWRNRSSGELPGSARVRRPARHERIADILARALDDHAAGAAVSVLRPNELEVPRVGLLQSAMSVLALVLVAGAIISRILSHSLAQLSDDALGSGETLLISCLLVAGVLAFLGLLVVILSFMCAS